MKECQWPKNWLLQLFHQPFFMLQNQPAEYPSQRCDTSGLCLLYKWKGGVWDEASPQGPQGGVSATSPSCSFPFPFPGGLTECQSSSPASWLHSIFRNSGGPTSWFKSWDEEAPFKTGWSSRCSWCLWNFHYNHIIRSFWQIVYGLARHHPEQENSGQLLMQ